jgi:hypothetical protein
VATSKPANELRQDKSIYNPPMGFWANIFCNRFGKAYTGQTWTEGTATQGCDQSADSGPEWRAAQAARSAAILAESDKSWEREGRALASKKAFFLTMPVRSWYASFEVRT